MTRTRRPRRRRPGLRLERLEFRLVLSALGGDVFGDELPLSVELPEDGGWSPPAEVGPDAPAEATEEATLNIVAAEPAAGATLGQSPEVLVVVFDRPIDSQALNGTGDLTLEWIEADGTATPALDPEALPAETLDATGTRLSLSLDAPLAPGRYRLRLSDYASPFGLDGSTLSDEARAAAVFSFTIEEVATIPEDSSSEGAGGEDGPANPPPVLGPTLADAIDLGTIGGDVVTIPGVLEFAGAGPAVALYKITLPGGHSWRLGLEVTARRSGSALDATLSLFDAEGRPLTVAEHGRADAPTDPFLFAGLAPGTYYVGVSGAGHLPGADGGYDPITGGLGAVERSQDGGAFSLALVADPADAATALVEATLDRIDPADPVPSGISLRFSGSLGLGAGSGSLFERVGEGIEVVDASGRTWPVAASAYDEGSATISYLFRRHLPEGKYTVRLPRAGGLVDLAGRAPIAPGLPQGTLATFDVAASPEREPTDLGALAPDDLLAGVTRAATIPAGGTITFSYAIPFRDLYRLSLRHVGGPVTILRRAIDGPGVSDAIDAGPADRVNSLKLSHGVGRFILSVSNVGDEAAEFSFTLDISGFSWESLLSNGVGQGPALNLRLVSAGPTTPPPGVPTPGAEGPGSSNPPPSVPVVPTPSPSVPVVSVPAPQVRAPSIPEPATPTPATPVPPTPAPATPAPASPSASAPAAPSGPTAGPFAEAPSASHVSAAASSDLATAARAAAAGTASPVSAPGRGPSGFPLDIAAALVGRPNAEANSVAAVGPASAEGAVAIAEAGRGFGQVLASGPSLGGASLADGGLIPAALEPGAEEPSSDGSLPPGPDPAPGLAANPIASEEDAALASTSAIGPDGAPIAAPREPAAETLAEPTPPVSEVEPAAEEEIPAPSLVSPWTLGLLGIAALLGVRALRGWNARRRKPKGAATVRAAGPHATPTRVRV